MTAPQHTPSPCPLTIRAEARQLDTVAARQLREILTAHQEHIRRSDKVSPRRC